MAATPAEAMEAWHALQARLGDKAEPPAEIVSMAFRGQGMFALRTGPFPERAGAAGFCADVRAVGGECWAMTPGASAIPMAAAVPAARTAPVVAPVVAPAPIAVAAAPAAAPTPVAPAPAPAPAPAAPAPTARAVAAAPAEDKTPSPAVPLAAAPPAAAPVSASPPRAAVGPRVSYAQLAAATSAEGAQGEWSRLRSHLGGLLRDRETVTQTAEVGGRTVWRLRAGPFQQSAEAEAFCAEVRSAGGKCWAATVTSGG